MCVMLRHEHTVVQELLSSVREYVGRHPTMYMYMDPVTAESHHHFGRVFRFNGEESHPFSAQVDNG